MFDHNRRPHYSPGPPPPGGAPVDEPHKGCGERQFQAVSREEFDALTAKVEMLLARPLPTPSAGVPVTLPLLPPPAGTSAGVRVIDGFRVPE